MLDTDIFRYVRPKFYNVKTNTIEHTKCGGVSFMFRTIDGYVHYWVHSTPFDIPFSKNTAKEQLLKASQQAESYGYFSINDFCLLEQGILNVMHQQQMFFKTPLSKNLISILISFENAQMEFDKNNL